MAGSPRRRPDTSLHRVRGNILRDEVEHLREVPEVMVCPAWMMLDPERPRGGGAGNLAWLAADTNDEHVQAGAFLRHRPRSVVPRGSARRASRLTTWRHIRPALSLSRHPALTEVSPCRQAISFFQ